MRESGPETPAKPLMEVADRPKLVLDPTRFDLLQIATKKLPRIVSGDQRLVNRFSGQHSTLDSDVNAFESLLVHETGGIADNESPIDVGAGH